MDLAHGGTDSDFLVSGLRYLSHFMAQSTSACMPATVSGAMTPSLSREKEKDE